MHAHCCRPWLRQVKREKQQMLDWAESERRKVEKWTEEQRQAIAKEKKGKSLDEAQGPCTTGDTRN